MVWRSFNKKINLKKNKISKKNTSNNISNIFLKKTKNIKDKSVSENKKYLSKSLFLKKSGIVHGIDTLTGKKVKDAFVMVQLKNFLKRQRPKVKKKPTFRFLKKTKGVSYFNNRDLSKIPDGHKLRANSKDSLNLFKSKPLSKHSVGKFIPPMYNSKWQAIFSGSIINNRQEEYLQTRKDIAYANYVKKGFTREIGLYEVLRGESGLVNANHVQDSENYNHFVRYYTYKNLLFKSFWFNKFVSTLVRCGKKLRVWGYILRTFSFLKNEFGRNPVILLFEILELYRMPVRGLMPKSSTRKSVIRTHLVPWWKQYTQILRWVRHALTGPVKNYISWNSRIKVEMLNLLNDSNSSLVKKRIESNFQLIAFGKIALHFRWHRRYSKRAVKAISVADRVIYEK